MARGNKAHRDAFVSIPAETKEMLRYVIPAVQHMPKIDRVDGAGGVMRKAAWKIIEEFYIAYRCPEMRVVHIERMIGSVGVFVSALEIACLQGIMREEFKLNIAMRLERIEEGIMKWYNGTRQVRANAPRERGDPAATEK